MYIIILFISIVACEFIPPLSIKKNVISQFSLLGTNYILTNNSRNYNRVYASTNNQKSKCLFYGYGITSIVVDHLTGNIYFSAKDYGIGVCTLLICHNLIKSDNDEIFSEILLKPRDGCIYWTQHKNGKSTKMIAGMNGANPRKLIIKTNMKNQNSLSNSNRVLREAPLNNPCEKLKCGYLCTIIESNYTNNVLAKCICHKSAIDTGDGRCLIGASNFNYMHKMHLISKKDLGDSLWKEYQNILQNNDLIDVSWALILFSLPIVLLSIVLSLTLINVIIIDYIEYINVISQ